MRRIIIQESRTRPAFFGVPVREITVRRRLLSAANIRFIRSSVIFRQTVYEKLNRDPQEKSGGTARVCLSIYSQEVFILNRMIKDARKCLPDMSVGLGKFAAVRYKQ